MRRPAGKRVDYRLGRGDGELLKLADESELRAARASVVQSQQVWAAPSTAACPPTLEELPVLHHQRNARARVELSFCSRDHTYANCGPLWVLGLCRCERGAGREKRFTIALFPDVKFLLRGGIYTVQN